MFHGRLSDQFESRALACASGEDLAALLEEVTREMGFRYFALLHHAALRRRGRGLLILHNYPEGWEAELESTLDGHPDPVHAASARSNVGFAWEELGSLVPLSAEQREVLALSRRFGLGEGFTVPANVPGEPAGSCSFAAHGGKAAPPGRRACAELIGAHAFDSARRLLRASSPTRRPPRLSRRERQCLRLVGAGKTDHEIAIILGLGLETARHYVKRARAAYDVVSRTQLVVHALNDSSLSFDELLGPGPTSDGG